MNLHVSMLRPTTTIALNVPTVFGRVWIRNAYRMMRQSGVSRITAHNHIVLILMAVPGWRIIDRCTDCGQPSDGPPCKNVEPV